MTVMLVLAYTGLSSGSRVAMLAACCMLPVRGQLRTWKFMYLRDTTARAAFTKVSVFRFRLWTSTLASNLTGNLLSDYNMPPCGLAAVHAAMGVGALTCEEYGEGEQDTRHRPHEIVSVSKRLFQVVCHCDGRLALPLQLDLQHNGSTHSASPPLEILFKLAHSCSAFVHCLLVLYTRCPLRRDERDRAVARDLTVILVSTV